jgi:GNAT acetyltransferase-like protein
MRPGIRIDRLREDDRPALDRFLRTDPDASIFHRLEWHQVIEATYGHRVHYWAAWLHGDIVGAFPVVAVRHPVLGTKMLAMPYQYHSGLPVAADEAVQTALVEHALEHAREAGARYLEIRHFAPAPFLERLNFVALDSGLVISTTPLEGLTLKSVFRGHREFVGYAAKRGVEIQETNTLAGLRLFRRLYMEEQRGYGSPQAGWSLFENIHRLLPSHYRLLLAVNGGECLGGLLTLEGGSTVFARCSATSMAAARKLHISKALFWRAMSEAAQRGSRSFNFGVSARSDTGLIAFKEGWNAASRPALVYVFPLKSAAPQPGAYFDGFQIAKRVWRQLPMPLADWLGHQVTRWVC